MNSKLRIPLCWKGGSINEVIRGSLPFVFAMVALIGLLMAYPEIALWLPRYVMG